MDAIQSAAAANGAGGFAWRFTPRARAPDSREPDSATPPDTADEDPLRFTPGKAVLHLLTNSAESFKRVLTVTQDVRAAEAVSGFRVDAYA